MITGGSRGLGLAIARELGRLGAHVTIAARDDAELEAARQDLTSRGIGVSVIVSDLTDPTQASRLVERVVAERGRLDILVNNAGVIQVGPVEHMEIADFEEALAVHFWAPLQTMLSAIPVMRRQGGGRIVNVSSIGGKIGVAHLVPYCASKFALAGLSTAMRAELVKDQILVTTVSPGLMRTGSPFNAQFKGRHREEFTWFAVADSIPLLSIDAASAARKIVDACRCGDRGAGDRMAGEAGRRRECDRAIGRGSWHADRERAAAVPGRSRRQRVPQRVAELLGVGAVEADAAHRASGDRSQSAQ